MAEHRNITIHFDFSDGTELSYEAGINSNEDFNTHCLDFFNTDNLGAIVVKSDGSFISVIELLSNKYDYTNKNMRKEHNIQKMLIANAFEWRNDILYKYHDHLNGKGVSRRIVCAANKIFLKDESDEFTKEYLLIGARHWDKKMHEQANMLKSLNIEFKQSIRDQGFIDQFGEFHDRKDAWKIAEHMNQIFRKVSSDGTLYSENLY